MENNRIQGQGIYYELKDKPFWAAFLNLARHNAYITVNHIYKSLGLEEIDNDQNLVYDTELKKFWKNNDISPEDEERALYLLNKHFPFLEVASYAFEKRQATTQNSDKQTISKEEKEKMKKEKQKEQSEAVSFFNIRRILLVFLQQLHQLRNYYSHFKHSQSSELPEFDNKLLLEPLYNIFNYNVEITKKNYKYDKNNKLKNYEAIIPKVRSIDGGESKHHFTDENGKITKAGLLFFISLFLEKKDAYWMQKKISGFKNSSNEMFQFTNEVFCKTRIIIPKPRIETIHNKEWALLDMINELIRCPKFIYNRMKEKDRMIFHMPDDTMDESDDSKSSSQENTLLRYKNRFPYFALRFFDVNEVFKHLRFQIDLGNYHFSIYKKNFYEQEVERHLTRNLYGFARIQEYNAKYQPDYWQENVKELEYKEKSNTPFVAKTAPHYHIEQEKIGIKFVYKWPSLKLQKRKGKKDKSIQDAPFTPDAFMSVHELVPMTFYYFLLNSNNGNKDKSAQEVERVIRKTIEDIFEIYDKFALGEINDLSQLDKLLDNKKIPRGHLPKQLIGVLNNSSKKMEEMAKAKIKMMLDENRKLQNELNFRLIPKDHEGHINLMKPGKIASWLVKDIMRFQPVNKDSAERKPNNTKANSTEYRLMQRYFALFPYEKRSSTEKYINEHIKGGENPHPFLKEIDLEKSSNLLSLYEEYLDKRKEFLESICAEKWEEHQHILRLKVQKSNRETLVKGWKNGFNLPRGIFTEPIRIWFEKDEKDEKDEKKNCRENKEEKQSNERISDKETFNRVGFATRLIPKYFTSKKYGNDDVQPFYNKPICVHSDQELYLSPAERFGWREEHFTEIKMKAAKIKEVEELFLDFYKKEISSEDKKKKIEEILCDIEFPNSEEKEALTKELSKKKINDGKIEHKILKTIKTPLYLAFKSWQKFERELRLVKNQDILTWMMCKELLDLLKVENLKFDLKLQNLDAEKKDELSILKVKQSLKLPITVDDKNQSKDIIYIDEEDAVPLRQGNFKALVKDRRISRLLSFVDFGGLEEKDRLIRKCDIQHELDEYQKVRIEIFAKTLALEEKLITTYKELDKCRDRFSTLLNKWLDMKREDKEKLKNYVRCIINVRNAISHNQYPQYDKDLFPNTKRVKMTEYLHNRNKKEIIQMNIAKYLNDETEKAMDKIIEYIQ